jgi:hypothetical protein
MTVHAVELDTKPVHRSFRLTRPTHAAVASQVRPALVLTEKQARPCWPPPSAATSAAAAASRRSGGRAGVVRSLGR